MSMYDEFNEKVEEFKANPVRYLKSFAMDLVVVIVAVAYVFYQMVNLEPTNTNPIVLIAKAFISIVCGVVIKAALGENGFSKGYNSDKWASEEEIAEFTYFLAIYNKSMTGEDLLIDNGEKLKSNFVW